MLSNLSQKITGTLAKLRSKGRLTEADVDLAMREVRLALLEADVNFKIVKDFVAKVREKSVGHDVLESLTPENQVIAIVRDELQELLGGQTHRINWSSRGPTIIMLAGLQGTGKTTTAAKLAALLKREGKKPLLVACDVYRPQAILQLQTVGGQVGVPVYEEGKGNPVHIAQRGVSYAKEKGNDVVIIDTAGRLHVDGEMMEEAKNIATATEPHETLLALDAMTGQDAVNAAKAFNDSLPLTGVVLTKMDGDARGGAILSVRSITGVPVKFIGTGEKLDAIEVFHPDRMAGRILGMGDVLSLIETVEKNVEMKSMADMEARMRKGAFDFEDFLAQMKQMRSLGPMDKLMEMVPGMNKLPAGAMNVDEKAMKRVEAIVLSMTPKERRNPDLINSSRKKRIASGSGTSVQEVNRLLNQFRDMQKMMKQLQAMQSGKIKMPRGLGMARMMKGLKGMR
jgi:signal recognition particle subunit SRP54